MPQTYLRIFLQIPGQTKLCHGSTTAYIDFFIVHANPERLARIAVTSLHNASKSQKNNSQRTLSAIMPLKCSINKPNLKPRNRQNDLRYKTLPKLRSFFV